MPKRKRKVGTIWWEASSFAPKQFYLMMQLLKGKEKSLGVIDYHVHDKKWHVYCPFPRSLGAYPKKSTAQNILKKFIVRKLSDMR